MWPLVNVTLQRREVVKGLRDFWSCALYANKNLRMEVGHIFPNYFLLVLILTKFLTNYGHMINYSCSWNRLHSVMKTLSNFWRTLARSYRTDGQRGFVLQFIFGDNKSVTYVASNWVIRSSSRIFLSVFLCSIFSCLGYLAGRKSKWKPSKILTQSFVKITRP